MIADWFPGAIHVLDMYHLKNKVSMLFGLSSEGEDAHLKAKALKACDSYNPEQILSVISSWTPPSAAKADSLQDLCAYIKNNALAIRNHKLVNVHGSGWIEKGVDLMISRRLKNRGMAWTVKGSSNMIPFAVLRYNKQWSVYRNRRKGLDLSASAYAFPT